MSGSVAELRKPAAPAEPVITAPHVYVAMNAVMDAIGKVGISKDRRNKDQGYNFRGIDDVYAALNGMMAENRLLMLPIKMVTARTEKPTKSGGSVNYTQLTVDFKMVSALDGSSEIIQTVGEAMDSADKSSNKAQSAAQKYASLMVFMIPTEGDNDADSTTHQLAGAEDLALAHLRSCAVDGPTFKEAWTKNKDGWKDVLEPAAYTRVVAEMKKLAGKFAKAEEPPPPPPPPADDFGISADGIPY